MELESPYGTELLISTASSNVSNFIKYKIGTNSSSLIMSAFLSISTRVGSMKNPSPSSFFPPWIIFPPYFLISSIPSKYSFTAAFVCNGPHNVYSSKGSPIFIVLYEFNSFSFTLSYIEE